MIARFSSLALALAFVVLGVAPQRSDATDGYAGGYAGLYVAIAPTNAGRLAIFSHALAQPYVDGATILELWSDVEPAPGRYDFTRLDRWIVESVEQHKKISLGIIAGGWSPVWIYSTPYDVPTNRFDYDRSPGTPNACTVLTLPSVWNPTFLRLYEAMTVAVAAHIHELRVPGAPPGAAWRALRIVKIDGINNTTEELRLDASKADNGPCHQSDASAVWAADGFRPSKIARAWNELSASFAANFPGKLLSTDIIAHAAFPAVDEAGHEYVPARRAFDALTLRLLAADVERYRGRFAVQWDALNAGRVDPEVTDAGAKGAIVGWQMNGFLGIAGGSGCIYPGFKIEQCRSLADFAAILDNGIAQGGRFIEIQPQHIDEWAPAYASAHRKLLQSRDAE